MKDKPRRQRSKRTKPETVTVHGVTVRIYKRSRPTASGTIREIFEVADYSGGSRQMHSFSDHAAALDKARTIAAQLARGEVAAATMTSSQVAGYGRAVELLRLTGTSLEVAASIYAKAFKIMGRDAVLEAVSFYKRHGADQVIQKRVAEVVAELLASKEARGKSARYVGDLRARLARFADSFAVNISSVTTSDAQRWLDRLNVAPQTAKNFRTVVHALFAFAEARGYVAKGCNPIADVEHITANGNEIQIYAPAEFAALLKASSPDFLPMVALGGLAGLRTAEIQRLDWADIRLAERHIVVAKSKSKTASRRVVPICDSLAAWLAPYADHAGKIWTGTPNDLQDSRAACAKAAGVAWKPNALRHSFASYSYALSPDAGRIAGFLGNSAQVVHRHYRELVRPADAVAWFSVVPPGAAVHVQAPTEIFALPVATP